MSGCPRVFTLVAALVRHHLSIFKQNPTWLVGRAAGDLGVGGEEKLGNFFGETRAYVSAL